MRHKYPLTDLLKAEMHLKRAKEFICIGEGNCQNCVCSYIDECFIKSLEEVTNEIKLRRQVKSEANELN